MCYSLRFLAAFIWTLTVAAILLATPGVVLAQRAYSNVGRTPTDEEIRNLGVIVSPGGKDLPPGRGTAQEGAERYAKQCALCHGKTGEGAVADKLVLGGPGNPH